MKTFSLLMLFILLAARSSLGQNPFNGESLNTSTVATQASPSGNISYSGLTINYAITGVGDLKDLKFSQLQAWNLPGHISLQAKPAGGVVAISGSVKAENSGSAERDALPHEYRIMYWYDVPGKGSETHKVLQKTVQRPFSEDFSFEVPVKEGCRQLSIQIGLSEDPDPQHPMNPSASFSLNLKLAETEIPPQWEGTSGSGSMGKKALAAAAAAIAIGWAIRRKKLPGNKSSPPDPSKETAGYILQASSERLQLSPGQQAELLLTVWKVDGSGNYSPAPQAEISLECPSAKSGFSFTPAKGNSPLTCCLKQEGEAQAPNLVLEVKARVGESQYSRQIAVDFVKYEVEFF